MCRKLIYLISFVLMLGPAFSNIASGADPSLIGWWKLDDANGTTFADSSGYGNNGTITNPDTNPVRWTDSGYKGRALNFTSKTSTPYTLCDAPITLNTAEATLSFWMKMSTPPASWGPIIVLLSSSVNIDVEPDVGMIYVNFQNGGIWFGASTTFNDNNWHHITVTFSSSNSKIVLYGDGAQIASNAANVGAAITAVRLGGPRVLNQWRSYGGLLDEVAVFDRALSAAEVKSLFWYDPEWVLFATNPSPTDKATVSTTNVTLTWTAGTGAAKHHVYFGDNLDNVKNGTGGTDKGLIDPNNYSLQGLVNGKTYYWRIDEAGAGGSPVYTGVVWRFTVAQKTAYNPTPADGAKLVDPNTTLSWTAGMGAVSHSVYFGTNPGSLPPVSNAQTTTTYDPPGTLNYKTTYYWRIDEFNGTSTYTGNVWSFKTTPHIQITDPTLVGWWSFNEDEETIAIDWSGSGNHGEIHGQPLHVAGHDANAMQFDGVNDSVEILDTVQNDFTLMAWIKTTTPGPEGTAGRDGSGLIWSDYSGGGDHFILAVLGTKLSFDTGAAPTINTISNRDVVTGDWVHVAVTRTQSSGQIELFIDAAPDIAATHTTRTLAGSAKIAIGANLIDSRYFTGLIDEVRIYNRVLTADEIGKIAAPLQAWLPNPSNNSTNASPTPALSWKPGSKAIKHDVYFSNNWNDVNESKPAAYKGQQTDTTYTITTELEWVKTYYWRIDEVNGTNIWKGNIWSFTTAGYLAVDNFESYTNSDPNIIYKIWKDGVGYSPGNGTGSQVGYRDPDYAERINIHEGAQSMPVDYNNLKSPYYSEADHTFDTPQNWTAYGSNNLKSLTLWFRGYPASVGSFVESAGIYTITASGANIGDVSPTRGGGYHDEFHFGYKEITAADAENLVTIIAKVESVGNTGDTVGKAGVMIRQSLDQSSTNGLMCIRRITGGGYGVAFQYRLGAAGTTAQDVNDTGITVPYWIKLELQISSGNYGNLRAYYSPTGADGTWLQLGEGSQQIPGMTLPVYAGLAVTPQSTTNTRKATFSNVTITAGAAGAWKHRDIGIKSNVASPLYVTLQDSNPSPGTKTVTHPDPYILLQNTWQEWNIALSDFTGVDLTKIKKIIIGVGNRSAPQPVGIGTIYVDDIRLYIRRCIAGLQAPDFTGSDCLVNYQDLAILTDNWLISNYQVTPVPSDANLVGYYTFDGNFNDSSSNGNNGDPCNTGVTTITDPTRGQVASFDGINDYIAITRLVQDDFTLTAWLKTAIAGAQVGSQAWQGSGLIWSDVTGNANDFVLAVLGTKLSFGTGPTSQDTTSSGDVVTGQWVHVAVTRTRSSGRIEFFIDGILDRAAIHSNTGSLNANPEIHIGGNTLDLRYYTGLIDDVRIYSRALLQDEIAWLAGKTAPFTQPLYPLLTPQIPIIDANNDGIIDLRDYATLADTWLEVLLWP